MSSASAPVPHWVWWITATSNSGPSGSDVLGELADEGDVVDDLRGDPPADVADDHRVAEAEAEEVRGVDARVEAGDHEQAQVGEDDRALVAAGGGEGAVAFQRGLDVGGDRLAGAGQLESARPAYSEPAAVCAGWIAGCS